MPKNDIFQKTLGNIYNKFSKNPAKMLIVTGSIGYILSSAAQCFGVLFNNKLPANEKNYLFAQEFYDGFVNILGFIAITSALKYSVNKLFKTGKFSTKKVREYMQKNNIKPDFDVNLDEFIKDDAVKASYKSSKNLYTTLATVGGTILSASIITPVIRNSKAADFCTYQKNKAVQKPQINYNSTGITNSGNMKI